MRQLTLRQQEFERQTARQLQVDAAGLAVLNHLITEGTATPTELARRLEVSTAAMTLVIDRLEAAGHVNRSRHPSDRRKVVITPADHTVAMAYNQAGPLIRGVTDLADALTPEEQAAVTSFLERVVAVYDRSTAQGREQRSGAQPARAI
jgi:DNA-binding MarR family transcriptional regulator